MLTARRVKKRRATPLVPRTTSRRKWQKDAEDSSGSDASIEIFRDYDAIPVCKADKPFAEKVERGIHKPKESNYLTFLLSDDETTPKHKPVPGVTCSTPVVQDGNKNFFKNLSAILSPVASTTSKTKHDEEIKTKEPSPGDIKIIDLWMAPEDERSIVRLEAAPAESQATRKSDKNAAENGICDKSPGSMEVLKKVEIIASPREKPPAEPGVKQPSRLYPVCPLVNFSHKYRLGATLRVRRSNGKDDNKPPHEYPRCPLETWNFSSKNLGRATIKDELL